MENGKLVTIRDDGLVRTDYLFRISIKALIYNESGDLLVVKEHGLNWGLPGGGMDFGETFADALARELKEEVGYEGEFDFDVIDAADPMWLEHIEAWQIYIVCHVKPKDFSFSVGSDGEDMRFIDPADLARHDGSQVRYAQYFHSRLQDRLSSC